MTTTISRMAATVFLACLLALHPAYAQHEDHQPAPAATQRTDILGVIVCADGPPLPGAIIQLFKQAGGAAPLASALADQAGRFRIVATPGSYILRVTYLGHANYSQKIDVAITDRTLTLGALHLEITAVELEALVAAAEKERVQLRAGATVYDVKRAGTAAGGSVADALRAVPGIEMDAEGRITLRGNASVAVLINGRKAVLRDDALVAFLRQMPASALDRIETNTGATAREDAEGHAGVVNLVFDEATNDRTNAYSAAASGATSNQYTLSTAGSGSFGALTWNGGYAFSSLRPQTVSETTRENYLAPEWLRISRQFSDAHARHLLHSLNGAVTARLNAAQTVAVHAFYSWMRGTYDNRTDFTETSASGVTSVASVTSSTLSHTIPTLESGARWTYQGGGAHRPRFSTEVRVTSGNEHFWGDYADGGLVRFLGTRMTAGRREIAAQADAALDVAGARWELGLKAQRRSLDADYRAARDLTTERLGFSHDQDIAAGYLSASRTLGAAFIEAGLRAEASTTAVTLGDADTVGDSDVRLFPAVSIHWPHERADALQYRLAYNRRIQRPDASALNPYSMGEDDMNSFIGNPMLLPEISDQIELAISRRDAGGSLQATPFVQLLGHPIRPIKAVTASGRATTALQNLRRARSAGIDLTAKRHVHERIELLLSSTLFYMETSGRVTGVDQAIERTGWYGNLRAQVDVQVAPNTSAQLYAYRRSAYAIEQGEIRPTINSDFALVRRIGHDRRGTLTLRISDPLNANKLAFHMEDATFMQHSERKVTSRMAALSFSWSVGGEARPGDARAAEKRPEIF